MRLSRRTTATVVGAAGLVLGILTAGQGLANAAPAWGGGTSTCTGTVTSPGELTGTYDNLVITGACVVQDGPVQVRGNLTVAQGAALTAIFGQDDLTSSGNSNLTVHGNFYVQQGASVMLGCSRCSSVSGSAPPQLSVFRTSRALTIRTRTIQLSIPMT